MSKKEFKDLIFYEIYPTSFYDSNKDGIGDLNGIKKKLDYISDLGCNAIWLNPFYKSPFKDGGYDIEDFFKVDQKFGTIKDFKSLCETAHKKGIKIIVDLVAGHASIKNKEFIKSTSAKRNKYSDLFIWNDSVWEWNPNFRLMAGLYDRSGAFLVNFFAHQPAFNYGFYNIDKSWQMSYQDERTYLARNYMLKVMRYWLNLGADGFRVDMADSLVKNDPDKKGTIEVWKYLFSIIRKEYPDVYFVSEWSNPSQSLEAGFDADFVLDHWDNFYHLLVRSNVFTRGTSLFNNGEDKLDAFMNDLRYRFSEAKKYHSYLAMISGNHDTPRIADFLDLKQLKMFYMFLLSMPGTPFIYYGDELMMKTSPISSKDGGYQRTGVRTPMIWDNKSDKHGFSNFNGEIYLPFYKNNKISVEDAKKDKNSLYSFIKNMIQIRKDYPALNDEEIEINNEMMLIRIKYQNNLSLIMNLSNDPIKIDGKVIICTSKINKNILECHSSALIENN